MKGHRYLLAAACVSALAVEAQTSWLRAHVYSALAGTLTYETRGPAAGESLTPHSGPYDYRLGYAKLEAFEEVLRDRRYATVARANPSSLLRFATDVLGHAVYGEKDRAGLTVTAADGRPLYSWRTPQRTFGRYEQVSPLLVRTLLFIEDRDLLDADSRSLNPAVNGPRFILACLQHALHVDLHAGGASTLATQLQKFRHSHDGLTRTAGDKARQMIAATLAAYESGADTRAVRRDLVPRYLDSTPLGARQNTGEVIGLLDGMQAWYGSNGAGLFAGDVRTADRATLARSYKQALSLLLAQRRPAYYLVGTADTLEARTNQYLDVLLAAGVIDRDLADAMRRVPLRFVEPRDPPPFHVDRGVNAVRSEVLSLLRLGSLHDLERLDLEVQSSLNANAQQATQAFLDSLRDARSAGRRGLVGKDLLDPDGIRNVSYSIVLYERQGDRNVLRVQADTSDGPFDFNSGGRTDLGSTAKLRVLTSYLLAFSQLHARLDGQSPEEWQRAARSDDALTRFAGAWFASSPDRSLKALLAAAMERRYSANPGETFFTGGGLHHFANFHRLEDALTPTVAEAFQQSINLAFVRLLRDVASYRLAAMGIDSREILGNAHSAARRAYLSAFADREGQQFLDAYYGAYRNLLPEQQLQRITARSHRRIGPARMYLALHPEAATRRAQQLSLADRAYLAGVHPLELWLVAYLGQHPGASRADVVRDGAVARQDAYEWLFRASQASQNLRIQAMLEQQAFNAIRDEWMQLGYPFAHIVPSLATALGSSGDRPEALARLVGTILADGVALPTVAVESLAFASGSPYEIRSALIAPRGERVMPADVARTLRVAMRDVVEHGTGQRLMPVVRVGLLVGGKTGTGDSVRKQVDRWGNVTRETPVSRSATFVFYAGDRYFGTVTARIDGKTADRYHFTSSLAVELLRQLSPVLFGPGERAS